MSGPIRSHRTAIVSICLMTAALLLMGCGSSAASSSTTSTTSAKDRAFELVELLPTAKEFGPDYHLASSSYDDLYDDDGLAALNQATFASAGSADPPMCPGSDVKLDLGHGLDDAQYISFTTDDGRAAVAVVVAKPKRIDQAWMDRVTTGARACGTFRPLGADATATATISAEPVDIGDYGIDLRQAATQKLLGTSVSVSARAYAFVDHGLYIEVAAQSGIDPETHETVPPDGDVIPGVAAMMATRIAAAN